MNKPGYLLLILWLFITAEGYTQTPGWSWARSAGGSGNDYASDVTADAAGNVYIAGGCFPQGNNAVTFDTASATGTVTGNFIAKYGPDGRFIWARQLSSSLNLKTTAITADPSGRLYICGSFTGSGYLGPDSLINAGYNDVFVARLDTAGQVLWARSGGSRQADWVEFGIATDGASNVYFNGDIGDTATFGPIVANSKWTNIFTAKYDSSGNPVWVRVAGGVAQDRGFGISADAAGNVAITGFYFAAATFGNSTVSNVDSTSEAFIARYDVAGNLQWVKPAPGQMGFSTATDHSGNVFVAGTFSDTIHYGGYTLIAQSRENFFLAKYSSSGTLQWAQGCGGIGPSQAFYQLPQDMLTDAAGNLYLTGTFSDSAYFGPVKIYTPARGAGVFVVKFDPSGNLVWVVSGNAGSELGGLCASNQGSFYICGSFNQRAQFGNAILQGTNDLFIACLSAATGIPNLRGSEEMVRIYPVPSNGLVTVVVPGPGFTALRILDGTGRAVFHQSLSPNTHQVQPDLRHLPNGIYYLELQGHQQMEVHRLVLQR